MEVAPHLTLIVPVYNSRHHLSRMLRDLASACPTPRWDLVVVDDGSSQDLQPVIRAALANGIPLSYVRLRSQSGPGEARNVGLRLAKGSHVAFVDVDDFPSVPEFVALMDAAERMECPVAAGSYQIVSSAPGSLESANASPQVDIVQVSQWAERLHDYPAIWSFVIQRKLLQDRQIFFPSISYAEDVIFLIRLSQVESTFLKTRNVIYSHNVSANGGSGSASSTSVAAGTVLEALSALRQEGAASPKVQRDALASWRLRISGRMLASGAVLGLSKRAALMWHLTGVLAGHPVLSVRTIKRWSSRRFRGGSLTSLALSGDESP